MAVCSEKVTRKKKRKTRMTIAKLSALHVNAINVNGITHIQC